MKKILLIGIIAVAATMVSFTILEKATWNIDTYHAKIGFSATHMMISDVEGYFKRPLPPLPQARPILRMRW